MDKQELKITKNMWPVIVTESDEGDVTVVCPFLKNCKVQGNDKNEVMNEIEGHITQKIKETERLN